MFICKAEIGSHEKAVKTLSVQNIQSPAASKLVKKYRLFLLFYYQIHFEDRHVTSFKERNPRASITRFWDTNRK